MNTTATYYQTTVFLSIFIQILLDRRRAFLIEAPDDQMKPGTEIRIRPDEASKEVEHPAEIIARIRTATAVDVCVGEYEDTGDDRYDERYLVEFDIEEDAMKQAGMIYVKEEHLIELAKMTDSIVRSKADYNEDREAYLEEIVQQNIRFAAHMREKIYRDFPIKAPGIAALFGMGPSTFSLKFTGTPEMEIFKPTSET